MLRSSSRCARRARITPDFVLKNRLAALLPRPARRALRAALDWPADRAFAGRLRASAFQLPTGEPVLSYGAALTRESGAVVHGGRVKLTHLDRAFSENASAFNLLYMVSSAIPPHARELVRFAKERGVKFVWNQNGVGFPGWAGADAEDFNGPMRTLRAQADFVVYQSRFCQESAERFLGPAHCASEVLYNPVDLAQFCPAPAPPELETWRLLAAGTHMEAERVTRAIATLAELRRRGRRAELTVAGEFRWSGAASQVSTAIERAGMAEWVRLRPAYSQAEAVALLQGSHVLLHLKYADPCPTAVVEALACGVPVVGSRSGGLPELLGEEGSELLEVPASWLVRFYPAADVVADAVENVMRVWPEASGRARARAVRLFGHEPWVCRHGELFHELLRQP